MASPFGGPWVSGGDSCGSLALSPAQAPGAPHACPRYDFITKRLFCQYIKKLFY